MPHLQQTLDCLKVVFPDLIVGFTYYGRAIGVARDGRTPGIYLTRMLTEYDPDAETRSRVVGFRDTVEDMGVTAFVSAAIDRLNRATPLPRIDPSLLLPECSPSDA